MTAKEKARELFDKIYEYAIFDEAAKQCALIAIDEIIKSREDDGVFNDLKSAEGSEYYTLHPMYLTYWKEVKKEIESYD